MGYIYVDQKDSKDAVRNIVNHIHSYSQEERDIDRLSEYSAEKLQQVADLIQDWNVDPGKFMALLRSQVLSGNNKGAQRIIGIIPDRRMRLLPLIVTTIILWPFRLVGNIIGLGLKRG
jgi:hypothetical protein